MQPSTAANTTDIGRFAVHVILLHSPQPVLLSAPEHRVGEHISVETGGKPTVLKLSLPGSLGHNMDFTTKKL